MLYGFEFFAVHIAGLPGLGPGWGGVGLPPLLLVPAGMVGALAALPLPAVMPLAIAEAGGAGGALVINGLPCLRGAVWPALPVGCFSEGVLDRTGPVPSRSSNAEA